MFFAEPERAFANLRSALKPSGRVAFSCFRTPKENGLITTILAAVTEFVPPLPKTNPDDPGPFAFQDPERVKRILGAAGFKSITLEPVDVQTDISNGKGMAEALVNAMEIGPRQPRPQRRRAGDPAPRPKPRSAPPSPRCSRTPRSCSAPASGS